MIFLKEIFHERMNVNETIPPVIGDPILDYHFVYTRKQWVRGHIFDHEVEGNIKVGILKHSKEYFKWNIQFTEIVCRKKTNYIPEYYILWNYIQRANFYINSKGKITTHDFISFGQNQIYKEKVKKISQYIQEEQRKKLILNILKNSKKSTYILASLLNTNPIIQLLCKEFEFHNTNKTNDGLSTIKSYYTKDELKNYFGSKFHLPIKKFSILDNRDDEIIIGSSIGGVDNEKIKNQDLLRYIKKIAGKVNIGKEFLLDYSEYYTYDKKNFSNKYGFDQAESYIQTAVFDAWFLEEQVILNCII